MRALLSYIHYTSVDHIFNIAFSGLRKIYFIINQHLMALLFCTYTVVFTNTQHKCHLQGELKIEQRVNIRKKCCNSKLANLI